MLHKQQFGYLLSYFVGVMGPPGPPGVSGGHPGVSGGPPGVAGGPPGVPMSPQIRPMGPAAGPINSSMMQARPVRPQMGPQGYWPPRPMMRPVPMMEQQQAVPMQGAANRMMMRPQPMIGSGHMAPPMMHSGPMRHPHMMQQNYSQAGPVVQAQPQYHRAEMEPDLAPPGTTPTLVSSQSKPVARSQEEDSDDSDDSSSSDDTDDTDNTGIYVYYTWYICGLYLIHLWITLGISVDYTCYFCGVHLCSVYYTWYIF